jgi:hypothetical protein
MNTPHRTGPRRPDDHQAVRRPGQPPASWKRHGATNPEPKPPYVDTTLVVLEGSRRRQIAVIERLFPEPDGVPSPRGAVLIVRSTCEDTFVHEVRVPGYLVEQLLDGLHRWQARNAERFTKPAPSGAPEGR